MGKRKRIAKKGGGQVDGFNLEKFEAEGFKARELAVPVPELSAFFDEGAEAVWRIRGLTGAEVARVKDSVQRAKDLDGLIAKLASANAKDKIAAVLEAFGLGADGESDDYVRRLTLLELGSVVPKVSRHHAVKVSEVAPLAFYRITDEIYTLTGRGKLGESNASGTIPESGQASPSVPGADSAAGDSGSYTN